MVRIKHRYLLVNILYPDPPPSSSQKPVQPPEDVALLPDVVQFHQPSPNELTPQLLLRTIREQVALNYGDYGAGLTASGLSVKYLSTATSTFILRCPRAHCQLVWTTLSYMTHLPKLATPKGKPGLPRACVLKVVRVSGTIRKAEEEAIRRARAAIMRARRESGFSAGGRGTMGLEGMLAANADDEFLEQEAAGIVDMDDETEGEGGDDDFEEH